MLKFIKIISAALLAALSIPAMAAETSLVASDGIRYELVSAFIGMALMALAIAVSIKKKGALDGLALALAASATLAAVSSAFYGFFGPMGASGFSIDIVLFAVAVGMFATSFFRPQRGFRYQALLFEGLMALFIFSVW